MARTDITLRADKGSALTFDEMDVNFSSFFYSASALVVDGANKLRLFYTGSSQLDAPFNTPTYTEITLPTAVQSTGGSATDPFGSDRQIQFNNNGVFGASSALVFTEDSGEGPRLGVGSNPNNTLEITSTNTNQPTIFNLNASSNTSNQNSKAFIQFRQGGSTFAQLGKRNTGNNDIDLFVKSKFNLGTHNYGSPTSISKKLSVTTSGVAIGNGIDSSALSELSILGDITIGGSLTATEASYIGSSGDIGSDLLPAGSTTTGLLIQSPKSSQGGHVVIGINTDNNSHESFSIVKGTTGNYSTSPIATFKADGNVGINKKDPIEKLHVEGNITGSGNINVKGTGTIQDIPELSSLSTDWVGSTEEYARTLVKTEDGLVQYMDAAPIPKGGIIMWSGTVDNIPTGWRLCDGNGGVQINGITIPNLSNRFVVAAGNTSGNPTTNIEGSNKTLGGSNSYTPEGCISIAKLTVSNVPRHTHMHLNDDNTYLSNVSAYGCPTPTTAQLDRYGGGTGTCNSAAYIGGYDACSKNGDRRAFHTGVNTTSVRGTTPQSENSTVAPSGTFSGTAATVVPNYYALGFIIYVGVA